MEYAPDLYDLQRPVGIVWENVRKQLKIAPAPIGADNCNVVDKTRCI